MMRISGNKANSLVNHSPKTNYHHCHHQESQIKFTVFTRNRALPSQDLINQLNGDVDKSTSETILSKYFEPYEISYLMNNSKNYLYFFYLNISSLFFA